MNRNVFINDTAQMHAHYHNRTQPNDTDFAQAEIVTQQHEQARLNSGLTITWVAAPVNEYFKESMK
jgi:hypothetical protein